MPAQEASWTCAACAQAWVLRSTSLDAGANEWQLVNQIGYPDEINSTYGLMDAGGSSLRRVYRQYGQPTEQAWLSFDEVYDLVGRTTGQMSGARMYHWVALRGRQGPNLWVANSAPGYKGVWDVITRDEFERLGGWSVVWLTE